MTVFASSTAGEMKNLRMALEELLLQAALVVISSVLFVIIVLFTLTTTWAEYSSNRQQALSWWVRADVGTTILVVRILQGLLTATATAAVCSSFTRLHWRKMSRHEGIKLADLVALAPTTLFTGTIRVIFSSSSERSARFWAICRLTLTVLPWLGGILLFARTSIITVLDTATVYDVTAGIGPFNASYVAPFLETWTSDNLTYVPYTYSSVVHNLMTNSLFSTVADPLECQQSEGSLDCASYILSGGLNLAAPWTPPGNLEHQLVSIPEVPTVQVEFEGRSGPKTFKDDECVLIGSNDTLIAAELCLAVTSDRALHAGLFLCNGTSFDSATSTTQCITDFPQPNLTTTLTLHHRTASILGSRSNLTILSLSDLSEPTLLPFTDPSLAAYRSALGWLIDYKHSGIPGISSILEVFWSNQATLNNTYGDGFVLQNFRSMLAFPVWLFNANNYGNTQVQKAILNPNLPKEFYTTAAVVKPLVKLKFDSGLLFTFVVMEALVLIVLWVSLLWLFLPWGQGAGLVVTSFPVMDFLFRAEGRVGEKEREELRVAGGGEVLKSFGSVRIHARMTEPRQRLGKGTWDTSNS